MRTAMADRCLHMLILVAILTVFSINVGGNAKALDEAPCDMELSTGTWCGSGPPYSWRCYRNTEGTIALGQRGRTGYMGSVCNKYREPDGLVEYCSDSTDVIRRVQLGIARSCGVVVKCESQDV